MFIIIIAFIFGLLVGSFLNVCIYRLPRPGMSIIKPRSHCPDCKSPISWYQNIPVLSYIFLGGKCASCRTHIALRYPLVELLTGLLFALAAYKFLGIPFAPDFNSIILFLMAIYLVASLIAITFIDFDFRIIPDEISISGIILALVASALFPFIHEPLPLNIVEWLNGLLSSVVGIIAGGGAVWLVGVIGKAVFRKEAMGFGDVKLMAFLGGFMGWKAVLLIFMLGSIYGAVVGIIIYIIKKDHYMAFGPYLALGALTMLFFKPEVVHFIFTTYPQFIRGLMVGNA